MLTKNPSPIHEIFIKALIKCSFRQVWQHIAVISALGRLSQEALGYKITPTQDAQGQAGLYSRLCPDFIPTYPSK